MDSLFAWYNMIFYIPIMFGIILVFTSAFGLTHGDADTDHDMHTDHDTDSTFARALSVLGVGRVPITIVLMMASLIFGGMGVALNFILEPIIGNPLIYAWLSIGIAFASMIVLTNRFAQIVARFMPSTETYNVSKYDFKGQTGVLLYDTDELSGAAQIHDHEGSVHNIQCRTTDNEKLTKGANIIVIHYDDEQNICVVTKFTA